MSELKLEAQIDRYSRNIGPLTPSENEQLHTFRVCVVGCGGLGGNLLELLGRLGIGFLTAVDGDVFEITNLNRQLLCKESNLGKSKALAAAERLRQINSDVVVRSVAEFLTEENSESILFDHDLVIDALDNVPTRMLLQNQCERLGIPLVHGAVNGWFAQISSILPGDRTLDKIYFDPQPCAVMGNTSFVPALAASIQVAEAVKILLKKGDILRHKLLMINLLNQEYEVLTL